LSEKHSASSSGSAKPIFSAICRHTSCGAKVAREAGMAGRRRGEAARLVGDAAVGPSARTPAVVVGSTSRRFMELSSM